MFDFSSIPVDNIKKIWAAILAKKMDLDTAEAALDIAKWAVTQIKLLRSGDAVDTEVNLIGAAHVESDQVAIEALISGDVVVDGAAGGGVLLSVALSILVKVITREVFNFLNK